MFEVIMNGFVSEYELSMFPDESRLLQPWEMDGWGEQELAMVAEFLRQRDYIVVDPVVAEAYHYAAQLCPVCGVGVGGSGGEEKK
jgi:hypothetical protein